MIRDDIISLADVDTIAGSPYMLVAELVTDPAAATGGEGLTWDSVLTPLHRYTPCITITFLPIVNGAILSDKVTPCVELSATY
jgi:hypothetical protein